MKRILNFLFPARALPFLLVICAFLFTVAAAPHQTPLPPTATPVPPVDVVGNIVDQIAGVLITALIAAVAWLFNELRKLKAQVVITIENFTPDAWEWVIGAITPILVRAVCQALPQEQAQRILTNFQSALWRELSSRGVTIRINAQMDIAAVFEKAVHDFYAELAAPSQMKTINRSPNP